MKSILLSALLAASPLISFAQNYAQPPAPMPSNEQQIQPAPQQQQQAPMQPQMQAPMQQGQPPMQAPPNVPVGDPSYYGQVDLVNNTQPAVVYTTPVVVQAPPPGAYYPPVYLRVPPMYYQNWPQYCGYYNACYYPVFFVQDSWYLGFYSPWYRRYYPYGRPGFVAHVYWGGGHGGAWHGDQHYDHGGHHDEHRY
jgi:hypothetical protein